MCLHVQAWSQSNDVWLVQMTYAVLWGKNCVIVMLFCEKKGVSIAWGGPTTSDEGQNNVQIDPLFAVFAVQHWN